ncbi:splicing factor, suppressor of white-apricot homolog [Neosynchiropus ocellatus]
MHRRGGTKTDPNNKPVKKDVSDSDKYADLLVFGYACKLFRDDERALYHDQGKHLIPWMGDKRLMIDRYDGRGHLHDLSEYDSGSWNTSYQLSEEEARIETLCDEERYLALHTDLLEEEARQEEEYKRLSEALADEGTYNAVAFKYSADYYDPSQPTEEEEAANRETVEAEPEESEEPFVAPQGLMIPPDVELPATVKTHNIIERTANFVCQQGAQFEIVLKAKQAGNSQFDFLRFDHYLNPYYKHILRAMKEGRYNLASNSKQDEQGESSEDSDDDGDGSYLHPSLFAPKKSSRLEELMKPLQVMDPDHPLAALVRKAKQEQNGTTTVETKPEEVDQTAPVAPTPQYTTEVAAPAVYYGYYMLPDGSFCLAPPPPGVDATAYYSNMPGDAVAPPASSVSQVNAYAAPKALPEISPYNSLKPEASVTAAVPAIIPPPPDIQPVIDKLAEYVARNGVKFEASVRAKKDPRFDFLQPWNQYNSYYEYKKNYFMQKEGKDLPETGALGQLQPGDSAQDAGMSKGSFAPICFAIKTKDNDLLQLEKNRVRLDDDSDEDKFLEGVIGEVIEKELPVVISPEEKKATLTLEELEAKQAKQKLEDRLAAAAREKLAQASKESKEKQLQAERKRKAALFLQTLQCPLVGEPEAKRAELDFATRLEMQKALSLLTDLPSSSIPASCPQDQGPVSGLSGTHRGREVPSSSSRNSSSGADHGRDRNRNRDRDREKDRERDKGRDKDKKKKKHKRRSRSRSRSRSRHGPASSYRRGRRSRSRSTSRRDRRESSSERRRGDRDRERRYQRRSSSRSRGRSRSRSPAVKRKSSMSSSGKSQKARSSISPNSSPSRVLSRSVSPTSSLTLSRGVSQEKEEAVSSAIVSSVQSKITEDLMVKVRAMLANSKAFQSSKS